MSSRIVALVPLRGGSKSIPHKNIRSIAGRPLCAWCLEAATRTSCIDAVYVSTDSDEIADTVTGLGLGVTVIRRPAELATDSASTESVMMHFCEQVPFDILVTIQATSPLTSHTQLELAIEQLLAEGMDSMLTGTRFKRFVWNDDGTPINYRPRERPLRQDFVGLFVENGAFYLTRRDILENEHCRVGGRIGLYEMPPDMAIELDEPEDWEPVERLLYANTSGDLAKRAQELRLLAVDVDGTLTDGGMYYDAAGEALKRFSTRDAKGLELIREAGVDVCIITGEDSPIVRSRAKKLGIRECFCGIKNKLPLLQEICTNKSILLNEVAFVGDDIGDLECVGAVGIGACPADACTSVRRAARFVSSFRGGYGAVREFCDAVVGWRT